MTRARTLDRRRPTAWSRACHRGVYVLAALAVLMAGARGGAAARPTGCETVPGNLVHNCGFARNLDGWRSQAVTSLAFDSHHGRSSSGALLMTNQPASEAGAATCVAVEGGATYQLSGWLRRLHGNGECLTFLEEHATPDCSAGALGSHELASTRLVPGTFTEVSGAAAVSAGTFAVRAGFACYGEQDDEVSGVLLDDVVLRKL